MADAQPIWYPFFVSSTKVVSQSLEQKIFLDRYLPIIQWLLSALYSFLHVSEILAFFTRIILLRVGGKASIIDS